MSHSTPKHSGERMASERMLMPKWARVAATVLSDGQIAASQAIPSELSARASLPSVEALPHQITLDGGETVDGTVSRKGKFGFTCESCGWVPKKGDQSDWVTTKEFVGDVKSKMFAAHWPERCKKCKSRMKRWTCAARKYDQLEILRTLEGRHCLRFLTLTREEWNIKVPSFFEYKRDNENNECNHNTSNKTSSYLWDEAEKLKKMATRQFRNWRSRNKYWISREAKGQA